MFLIYDVEVVESTLQRQNRQKLFVFVFVSYWEKEAQTITKAFVR